MKRIGLEDENGHEALSVGQSREYKWQLPSLHIMELSTHVSVNTEIWIYQVYINQDCWYHLSVEAILPEREDDETDDASKERAQGATSE